MLKKYSTIFIHLAIIFTFILLDTSKYTFGKQRVDIMLLTLYYLYDISFFYFASYAYLPFVYRKISQKTSRLIISFVAVPLYWLIIIPFNAFVRLWYGFPFSITFSFHNVDLVLLRGSLILGFAYVLWHNKYLLKMEKERNIERERNLQLENDLLRAQLNPHLVHNALGLVHEHLIDKSPADAEILEILAGITSEAFVQSKVKGDISLQSEIGTIQSYLRLHNLIKEGTGYVQFDSFIPDVESYRIAPYLLLEPVLNLLKYADLSSELEPGRIDINMANGILTFKTWNKKARQRAATTHHFGMVNLKSRLTAYYPSKYNLHVEDAPYTFAFTLNIEL